ncbi:hypothetical protein ACFQ0M_05420 [Kitasatospora aburaviensis]
MGERCPGAGRGPGSPGPTGPRRPRRPPTDRRRPLPRRLELRWPGPAPALTQSLRRQLHALAELCAGLLGESAPGPAGPRPPPTGRGSCSTACSPPVCCSPRCSATASSSTSGSTRSTPTSATRSAARGPRWRAPRCWRAIRPPPPPASSTGCSTPTAPASPSRPSSWVFQSGSTPPATVRIAVAPWGRRLLASWQVESDRSGEGDQAALLRQAQRIARVCGFEEHAATGRILWNEGLREIYGLPAEADPFRSRGWPTTSTRTTRPPYGGCSTPCSGGTAPPPPSSGWSTRTAPSATPGSSPSPFWTRRGG